MSRDKGIIESERARFRQWEENEVARFVQRRPEVRDRFRTHGGLPVNRVYTALDLADHEGGDLGLPGQYPFTRGPYPTMYRARLGPCARSPASAPARTPTVASST